MNRSKWEFISSIKHLQPQTMLLNNLLIGFPLLLSARHALKIQLLLMVDIQIFRVCPLRATLTGIDVIFVDQAFPTISFSNLVTRALQLILVKCHHLADGIMFQRFTKLVACNFCQSQLR